ncbi:NAD(P)/FAD-dependent oxidoreductase [Schnuerera sp.]|uniref:NAD(P)/FAD-dependent oxidoreductase n=1 Tax=Schnuerera sp. TaxID=2794844 RepID=UPI002C9DD0CB|nr:FAD-dependent oxidoreductase [Schnuerera sp.]HSH36591.1 FAD-dependent oxidoreductase [Schnuerera sp.]
MDFNFDVNLKDGFDNSKKLDIDTVYDIIVIGGGPAGLNAGLYSKRKGANVGIITKNIGGQVVDTSVVENYLGYPSLSGEELMNKFKDHVMDLDIPILEHSTVEGLKVSEDSVIKEIVLSDGSSYKAKSIILATGSRPRKLSVPGEDEYVGKGVAYCAICDGPLFAGLDVVVAGGGNSAIEAAIDLSKIANSVTIVHRSQLRADKILIDQINKIKNIEVHLNTQILEVIGEKLVTGVKVLDKATDNIRTISTNGIFVEIGALPNNDPFKDIVELNDKGEIIADKFGRTNVEGIFAAGDSIDNPYKQIIISAATGANAALSANEYLNTL